MSSPVLASDARERPAASRPPMWTRDYSRRVVLTDSVCAAAGAFAAAQLRFGNDVTSLYVALSLVMPVLWLAAVALAGGYDARFFGTGSEEFRKVLSAGVSLTALVALLSYALNAELSRGYLIIALPVTTLCDLTARYAMRKRLHRLRKVGQCSQKVIAVGHAEAVANLIRELRRDRHHGLMVVGACLAQQAGIQKVADVPVYGGLADVSGAVSAYGADTVAVLACPEMDGVKLRSLAWELEKTDTDLCVSPALLDVAGPRTTIRPTAGLTLLHVDHPQLSGLRLIVKVLFDRCVAVVVLVLLLPVLVVTGIMVRLHDGGPALFKQVRVGRDGQVFKIYKFRTMVIDAEQRKAQLVGSNDTDGVLFKLRVDPRVTPVGAHLRRWSIDELPQLLNVLEGHMSLVGPRPALPEEAARYAEHVRRRLVVKPGLTGLWQVKGRSNLSWEESVRLDLRYVENWSFTLDLQILWKTAAAVIQRSGAY